MRAYTWCWVVVIAGLAGCSSGTPSSPASLRVWVGEDQKLKVSVPGQDLSLPTEGKQQFSATPGDGFSLLNDMKEVEKLGATGHFTGIGQLPLFAQGVNGRGFTGV